MAHEGPEFLPRLTAAFVELGTRDVLETREFADACVTVLPIFNYLGEKAGPQWVGRQASSTLASPPNDIWRGPPTPPAQAASS